MGMDLESAINEFTPVSLEELNAVTLLNRTDTKFLFGKNELAEILVELSKGYRMLEINGIRKNRYRTLYFDTKEHLLYMLHHNQKLVRDKVRMRQYVDSGLTFLEVKHKTAKGRTEKSRITIEDFQLELQGESMEFVAGLVKDADQLIASLWNSFTRLTLTDNSLTERLTIDLDLGFEWKDQKHTLQNAVIAEVKQDKMSRDSLAMQVFRERGIRSNRISKYCTGCVMTHEGIKYNRFKEKILKLKKLERYGNVDIGN